MTTDITVGLSMAPVLVVILALTTSLVLAAPPSTCAVFDGDVQQFYWRRGAEFPRHSLMNTPRWFFTTSPFCSSNSSGAQYVSFMGTGNTLYRFPCTVNDTVGLQEAFSNQLSVELGVDKNVSPNCVCDVPELLEGQFITGIMVVVQAYHGFLSSLYSAYGCKVFIKTSQIEPQNGDTFMQIIDAQQTSSSLAVYDVRPAWFWVLWLLGAISLGLLSSIPCIMISDAPVKDEFSHYNLMEAVNGLRIHKVSLGLASCMFSLAIIVFGLGMGLDKSYSGQNADDLLGNVNIDDSITARNLAVAIALSSMLAATVGIMSHVKDIKFLMVTYKIVTMMAFLVALILSVATLSSATSIKSSCGDAYLCSTDQSTFDCALDASYVGGAVVFLHKGSTYEYLCGHTYSMVAATGTFGLLLALITISAFVYDCHRRKCGCCCC